MQNATATRTIASMTQAEIDRVVAQYGENVRPLIDELVAAHKAHEAADKVWTDAGRKLFDRMPKERVRDAWDRCDRAEGAILDSEHNYALLGAIVAVLDA